MVNKKIILAAAACTALLMMALTGCSARADEPQASGDVAPTPSANYTLTPEEKLKSLALGDTAVWRDYEVTVTSIDRADEKLTAHIEVKAHTQPKNLSTACLLSLGMPPTSSSFTNNTIEVPAGKTVAGTLVFDDRAVSQRLFWNDGATEATWLLDKTEASSGKADEKPTTKPAQPVASEAQKQAVTALEAEIPSLIANNTLYEYKSVDPATAVVAPRGGGGYDYTNTVSILDGNGNPNTVKVHLICEPNGNCISMEVDGTLLF